MKEKKDASSAADLIAAHDGKVISIVTREGTPQVHAGAKVKKGDVLLSGRSDRRWRCNSGILFHMRKELLIEGKKEYNKYLSKTYQKHGLEKHKKMCVLSSISAKSIFLHQSVKSSEKGNML